MKANSTNHAVSVTLTNVTPAQYEAIAKMLAGETAPTKRGRAKPAKTVSDDEDDDFGTKSLSEEDLEDDEAETDDNEDESEKVSAKSGKKTAQATDDNDETEEEEDAEDSEENDEEESGVTFAEVRAACNKYGEKHPDEMRAILKSFKIESPKALSKSSNEKHWAPIYKKVMIRLKAMRKNK